MPFWILCLSICWTFFIGSGRKLQYKNEYYTAGQNPFPHGARATNGQGLIIEASRSHSNTLHSIGLVWTSDQHVAETSTWQHTTSQETDIHAPGGNRTRKLSKLAAARNLRSEYLCLLTCTKIKPMPANTSWIFKICFVKGADNFIKFYINVYIYINPSFLLTLCFLPFSCNQYFLLMYTLKCDLFHGTP